MSAVVVFTPGPRRAGELPDDDLTTLPPEQSCRSSRPPAPCIMHQIIKDTLGLI